MQRRHTPLIECIRTMRHQEGILSFYKGLSSVLSTVPLVNAVVFGCYEFHKKFLANSGDTLSFYNGMTAGCFAGFMNCFLVGPIELAKCRLQMQRNCSGSSKAVAYTGTFDCFAKIFAAEGIRGIYRANVATQLREVPAYGAQFASYEYWKAFCMNHSGKDSIGLAEIVLGGGLSGAICWTISYPQDVIKTKLQCSFDSNRHRSFDGGFLQEGARIVRNEGFKGLWKGFSVCFARAFYANAIGFAAYEEAKELLAQNPIQALY